MKTVEPGLYKHYKGNLYRVLFVVEWSGALGEPSLEPDENVLVRADDNKGLCACRRTDFWEYKLDDVEFLEAKWSGNNGVVFDLEQVVYVALYGEGRVSVRTAKEFAEDADAGGPRFERIGP
jgi:hypothetical protein